MSIHIVDLLAPWAAVESRRMFGGYGLFARSRMFALIFDDILYLKDSFDEQGEPLETSFEKEYFEYSRKGEIARLRYYKAPLSALEDGRYLTELVEASWQSSGPRKKVVKAKTSSERVAKGAASKTKSSTAANSSTAKSMARIAKAKAATAKSKGATAKSTAGRSKAGKKVRTKPPASILNSPYLF